MRRLESPSLTPTSQVQGGAAGNAEAMAPGEHPPIPVSTQTQPTVGAEHQAGVWQLTESAGSA